MIGEKDFIGQIRWQEPGGVELCGNSVATLDSGMKRISDSTGACHTP
jgi:hypothetical protein